MEYGLFDKFEKNNEPLLASSPNRGHASGTIVQTSHFVTVIWGILNHEPNEHNKRGEILLGSATLW